MKEKKYFDFFFIIVFAFILSSCHSEATNNKNTNRPVGNLSVEGIIVCPTVLDQTITISGTLKPFEETVLMPEVVGRVVDINLF